MVSIVLRLPGRLNDRLEEELKTSIWPSPTHVTVARANSPSTSPIFGLSLPPDVLITIASGVASGMILAVLKALWTKVTTLVRHHPDINGTLIIIIDGRNYHFDLDKLTTSLPAAIVRTTRRGWSIPASEHVESKPLSESRSDDSE